MTNKISIIVPVYNTDIVLLNRCINSIINQEYTNIEIIIVFNGCNESYIDEIKRILNDNRIVFIETNKKGVSNARNIGIERAKGEYVAFVDADDTVCEGYLIEAMEVIEKKGLDIISGGISFIYQNVIYDMVIKKNRIVILSGEMVKRQLMFPDEELGCKKIKGYLVSSPCSKIYKKDIIGSTRFCEDIICREDFVFNYEVATKTDRIGIVGKKWYNYFQYKGSTTHKLDEKMLGNNISIISEIYRINKNNELSRVLEAMFSRMYYIYVIESAFYTKTYKEWKLNIGRLFTGEEFIAFKKPVISNIKYWRLKQLIIVALTYFRLWFVLYIIGKIKEHNDRIYDGEPIDIEIT